jgi:hypothetical protein
MNMIEYHKSLNRELQALKDRVRNLMDDPHWLTDGEWKETVLRSVLRKHLPHSVQVGRGFVLTPSRCSKQIDVLIYDSVPGETNDLLLNFLQSIFPAKTGTTDGFPSLKAAALDPVLVPPF